MRARTNVYHLECFACQQCGHRYVDSGPELDFVFYIDSFDSMKSQSLSYLVRFCVGDQFYLYDNKILCGPDYEERILFANLHQHPDRIAQIKNQTRLIPPGSSSLPSPSSTSSHPGYSQPHPSHGHPGYSFPSPAPGAPPASSHPKCANLNPLPPISSVKSLAKRTALAI